MEYFDFVKTDKLWILDLGSFAAQLGFNDKESIRFWHKFEIFFYKCVKNCHIGSIVCRATNKKDQIRFGNKIEE